MKSFHECMTEYRQQLQKGTIQKAYRGLMEYMIHLKNYLKNKYPNHHISGNTYYGYMDMIYFSFTPESLKSKKLKIAIVFIHEKANFEVWLAGMNKEIQRKYWKLFRESFWNKYQIPADIKGIDSIVEHNLIEKPNFNDLDTLTRKIEDGVLIFTDDIKTFLHLNER